ncbi:MAG: hypothetical protein WDO18_13035 [Acidobacteriota bacterium]
MEDAEDFDGLVFVAEDYEMARVADRAEVDAGAFAAVAQVIGYDAGGEFAAELSSGARWADWMS